MFRFRGPFGSRTVSVLATDYGESRAWGWVLMECLEMAHRCTRLSGLAMVTRGLRGMARAGCSARDGAD